MNSSLLARHLTLLFFLCLSSCKQKTNRIEQHYYRAAECSEKRDHKQALIYADKITQLESSPRSLALKATLLYQNNKLQESKKTFELALGQKNISPEIKSAILNNYATVLASLGKKTKAKAIWHTLTSTKEYATPEVAWFNLGMMAYKDGIADKKKKNKELHNAAHYFSKAITLEPEYVDAHFFKAKTLLSLKKEKEARELLKAVIALAPEHQEATNMLGGKKIKPCDVARKK
jgi:Tfp pilus assembly protein PilF